MRVVVRKNNGILVDALIIGIILALEVCFSKAIVIMIPFLCIRYLSLGQRQGGHLQINRAALWLVSVLVLTTIFGIRLDDNSAQFSVVYNSAVFICLIFIQLILMRQKEQILDIFKFVAFFTSLVTMLYIVAREYHMLIYRWKDFLAGNSGYRLGVSSGINPNTITWTFGFLGLLLLFYGITEKKIRYYFVFFLDLVIILFTGSKNGIILAFLPLVLYGIRALRKLNVKVIIGIIALIVVFWISIHQSPVLYTLIGRRIDSMLFTLGFVNNSKMIQSGIDVASTAKRLDMMNKAGEMFWKHPVFGWGIGAFAKFSGYGYYCHNNYMELLVSCGVVGFFIYYIYIFYLIIQSIVNKKSRYKDLALILVLSIVLLDFSTVNFYSNIVFGIRVIILSNIVYN